MHMHGCHCFVVLICIRFDFMSGIFSPVLLRRFFGCSTSYLRQTRNVFAESVASVCVCVVWCGVVWCGVVLLCCVVLRCVALHCIVLYCMVPIPLQDCMGSSKYILDFFSCIETTGLR